jgi:hypothetical protein
MEKRKPWVATAFTILGIVIGAGLNHFFAAKRDIDRNIYDARLKAYVAFMEGQGLRKKARNPKEDELANRQITKAKHILAMLSSQKVIKAMVDYWTTDPANVYPVCPDKQSRLLDAQIYRSIREEMIRGEDPAIDDAVLVPFVFECVL